MQIMAIRWKGVWERSLCRNGNRIGGHADADQACFERRMAKMRARVSFFPA